MQRDVPVITDTCIYLVCAGAELVQRVVLPGTGQVQQVRRFPEPDAQFRLRVRERVATIRPRQSTAAAADVVVVVQQTAVARRTAAPATVAAARHMLLRGQQHRPLRPVHVAGSRVQTPFR